LGIVIKRAWEQGARLDSWHEHFNYSLWQKAFNDLDMSVEEYATRTFKEYELLPWSHISMQNNKLCTIKTA